MGAIIAGMVREGSNYTDTNINGYFRKGRQRMVETVVNQLKKKTIRF